MKASKTLITLLFIFISSALVAQEDITKRYDFWVGDWDLTWKDPDGKIGKGKNHIVRILDSKVIQENFEALEGAYKGLKGNSISVYNPQQKLWHQAWADNQGGYFDFIGDVDGDKKIFKTKVQEINGKKIIQRMVFHSFHADGFIWDWESSQDAGETWTLNWQITYKKAK